MAGIRDYIEQNKMVLSETSTLTDKALSKAEKRIGRARIKQHKSIVFWRLIGCRLFGHKANHKKTHMYVAPGLYCGRCFRWVLK